MAKGEDFLAVGGKVNGRRDKTRKIKKKIVYCLEVVMFLKLTRCRYLIFYVHV